MDGSLFSWAKEVSSIYGQTSISYLKNCEDYAKAKHGSLQAAANVVDLCIKPLNLKKIKLKYPKAVLLPVISGTNKLPLAFAMAIGLKMHTDVHICGKQKRKQMNSIERFLNQPKFVGKVIKGESYILIDDVVTQGGTIAALRKHVIKQGGFVIAVIALACSIDSKNLAPKFKNLILLNKKFDSKNVIKTLNNYLTINNLKELTNSQIKYLLRFKSLKNFENLAKRQFLS